jgi:hydrogenase maturation protease
MSIRLLVIGYGNELRGDDGVGPEAARAVGAWCRPEVQTVAVQQLIPELADVLAGAEEVVFVDARLNAAQIVVQRLAPGKGPTLGHTSDPCWLLALTEHLHERAPPAWLVTVPAVDLAPGAALSATAARGLAAALRWIAELLDAVNARMDALGAEEGR